jgi:hypothetical protein
MLGDFHINLQLPLSHIQQSQFQQGIVQEIIQQFSPTQIVLFELLLGDLPAVWLTARYEL